MRPKLCVPIVESLRDGITARAGEYVRLAVDMAEWRVDFYAGYERELLSIVAELKSILREKELIVTLRTEAEGGEPNASRFDYFSFIEAVLQQGMADYVDIEVARCEEEVRRLCLKYADGYTKIIGSYHDFEATPTREDIIERLQQAKQAGCTVGKLACMPHEQSDVDTLLEATAAMKERYPEFPLITMAMGELGRQTRLYGGLYGSVLSFACVERASAPGQIYYEDMRRIFDKIYSGNKHIILIGFMGVGKSTISGELQRQTNRVEIDTDCWIEERENRTIADIFAQEGEEYFRQQETAVIDELGAMKPAVISCGGGMALRDLNRRKLQAIGTVVLLTAEPETIFERVKESDSRPLLNDNMNVEYIRKLMAERQPFYERAADVIVSTEHKMVSQIAKEILDKCL